jgi:MATE family multidrug resistance protein
MTPAAGEDGVPSKIEYPAPGDCLLAFPLGFGAAGLWLGLALGLAVVAIALGLRLQSRAQLQIRAAETIVLAACGVR